MTFRKTAIAALAIAAAAGTGYAQEANNANAEFKAAAETLANDAVAITTWAEEVGGIQNGPIVDVVALSELGDDGREFNEFLNGVELQFVEFWTKVEAQPDLAAALAAEGYEATDVVIYSESEEDRVTLYVDDIM